MMTTELLASAETAPSILVSLHPKVPAKNQHREPDESEGKQCASGDGLVVEKGTDEKLPGWSEELEESEDGKGQLPRRIGKTEEQ